MLTDVTIRALPKEVADKIAAGEVVERPFSVVKELVENAVDAGAGSITVEIRKGGKEYIRVTDNGRGIPKDQLALAFRRYATSKIATEEDLSAIGTLGFRGEALASIAAVSRTEMVTRTAGAKIGARIAYEGGEQVSLVDAACEEGTTILVRDLFYNLPARKKFLKPDSTESSLIADYLSKMALAYPERKFRLISNGSILFSTTGKGGLYQAILTLYSPQTARTLLPVNAQEGAMRLEGYVSSPDASRPNRRAQIFFVNGRWVRSRLMEDALAAAFSDKLFEGRYPVAYLFLTIDPSSLDVNVHPSKTEIKFYDEGMVRDFMVASIRRAMLVQNAAPNLADLADLSSRQAKEIARQRLGEDAADGDTKKNSDNNINLLQSTNEKETIFAELRRRMREREQAAEPKEKPDPGVQTAFLTGEGVTAAAPADLPAVEEPPQYSSYGEAARAAAEPAPEAPVPARFRFQSLQPLGQIFSTYIIATDEKNVYFIDQHAAHERVLYEQFLDAFNREETLSQPLLTPIVLQLTAAQKTLEDAWTPVLEALGFVCEEFGPQQVLLKEIPAVLDMAEAEAFAQTVLESDSLQLKQFQTKKDAITMASCKAAIKGGDRLHEVEARELFRRLDGCENPFSCPHGRPTFLRFSQGEIEHFFKRK